jgi:hypothetical protein
MSMKYLNDTIGNRTRNLPICSAVPQETAAHTETCSRKPCCRGKAISITYSECVPVALVIQHAKRMRHMSSVACPAPSYFSTLSHKRHDFRGKKVIEHNMCSDFLCNFCLKTFLILRGIQRDIINVHRSSCKVPIIVVRFSRILNFLDTFSKKKSKTKFSRKSVQMRAETPMRTDRRTNITKFNSLFLQFCKRA